MTTRYVGKGGDDANNGLTWALRKLTLNGAEDTPVVAGDTAYVGAGTYREQLTVDVSGGAGTPITYIGDYSGDNTDGVGGVVRITGSDDDIAQTRDNCIYGTGKDYRTFQGFKLDTSSSACLRLDGGQNLIFDKIYVDVNRYPIYMSNPSTDITIKNCYLVSAKNTAVISAISAGGLDDRAMSIENCILRGYVGLRSDRIGGITIKNCIFPNNYYGIQVGVALTAAQTITVNNSIFCGAMFRGMAATALGEIIEDYNSFYGNATDRANVAVGANSNTYPPLFDSRWFFETVR